jgi:hypothetical protein
VSGLNVLAVGHFDLDGIGIGPSVVDKFCGDGAVVVGAACICYVDYRCWW